MRITFELNSRADVAAAIRMLRTACLEGSGASSPFILNPPPTTPAMSQAGEQWDGLDWAGISDFKTKRAAEDAAVDALVDLEDHKDWARIRCDLETLCASIEDACRTEDAEFDDEGVAVCCLGDSWPGFYQATRDWLSSKKLVAFYEPDEQRRAGGMSVSPVFRPMLGLVWGEPL